MTFTAIRYKDLHAAPPPPPPEPAMHADRIGVSSWASGRLDLFARNDGEELVHKWWSDNAWHGWETLGGKLDSAPAAVSWAANRIDVFGEGTNTHLMHKWWDGHDWSGWKISEAASPARRPRSRKARGVSTSSAATPRITWLTNITVRAQAGRVGKIRR